MASESDLLLGRLALSHRMVTQDQLDHALRLQETGATQLPLGEILLDQKFITSDQLQQLLQAQVRRLEAKDDESDRKKREVLFGKMVLKKGLATLDQVNECLRLQDQLAAKGTSKSLGEVLVDRGFLTNAQVRQILADQNRAIMTCKKCGARYNVPSVPPTPTDGGFTCLKCGTMLAVPGRDGSIQVDATLRRDGSSDSLIGKELGGCKIIELIGRGTMGTVYHAKHIALNKPVAIKVLPVTNRNAEMVKRFTIEARAAAKLEHPNIVQVYNVGSESGHCYIVMQLIRGRDLGDMISDGAGFLLRDALHIVKEVAKGLDIAHSRGIVHRDLKPDNVMILENGEIRIADFGLAQDVEYSAETTAGGLIVGTPYYMAPEQWLGDPVDGRADLYSLGIILYQMITGQRPFEGLVIADLMDQHLKTLPAPPKDLNPDVTDGVNALCLKLIAKSPKKRYASARDLIEEIQRIDSGGDPLALEEYGERQPCGFCGHMNKKHLTKCSICGEPIGQGVVKLEIMPGEDEFACPNCNDINAVGAKACPGCKVPFCVSCRRKIAVLKGICAECIASGQKPAAAPPARKGFSFGFRKKRRPS